MVFKHYKASGKGPNGDRKIAMREKWEEIEEEEGL